ncbi:transposase [Chitinophaga sancti]|uniref:Transposase n=1 Tax=Chitinophaga sancti TaxID=1004 RepID=A0A1K1T0H2_9BACT|nr:Transposase [Chitinophaga sancti]
MFKDPNIEILQLWNNIKEKGYNGSRSVFYEHLKGIVRVSVRNLTISPTSIPYWSARKVSILLYRKKRQLPTSENELLNKLKTASGDIQSAASFVSRFRNLVERNNGSGLKDWMDDLTNTSLKELKSFAKRLLPDLTAVVNAISLTWSNGQVEGQINKLKRIKRQMYGRALIYCENA